jgi:hypothetical protein
MVLAAHTVNIPNILPRIFISKLYAEAVEPHLTTCSHEGCESALIH